MAIPVRVIICLFVFAGTGLASSLDPFEQMFDDVEREDDYLDLLNALEAAVKQPVNLLEADRSQLDHLPWMSPWLAGGIIRLRQDGELESVDDLKKIPGVNDRLIELLKPLVVVEPVRRRRVPLKGLVRLRLVASPASGSFRKQKGYLRAQGEYLGSGAGLVMEKDRLESQVNDFEAYYLEQRWAWGKVVLGDFMMASGHGLVFSGPYGHSPSTVSPWRFGQGDFAISPYTSVEENFLLRGVGLAVERQGLGLCLAAARSEFDAVLDDNGSVRSLPVSGYHTTEAERRGKDMLTEDLLGMAVRYSRNRITVDGSAAYARFNRSFAPGALAVLDKEGNFMGSIDVGLRGEQSVLFLQVAAANNAEAGLAGAAVDMSHLDLLVLARGYGRDFLSLHGRSFAFYSGYTTGERGLLTQLTVKVPPGGILSVGNDLHERHRSGDCLSGSSGSESYMKFEIGAGDVGLALAEKLLRSKDPPSAEGDRTREQSRLRSRIDVRYDATRHLWLRMRYENLHSREEIGSALATSASDLVRLDMGIDLPAGLAVKAGFYAFSVPDYASRIYQYEAGLPYYPDVEMLKADGSRWYGVISFRSGEVGQVAAKAGKTTYDYDSDRFEFLLYYSLRR